MLSKEFIRFYGVDIGFSPDVLTPRLETEALVQFGIKNYGDQADIVLDIGTGSGAIIAAVGNSLHKKGIDISKKLFAVEISPSARNVAIENFSRLGLEVVCEEGDLLTPFFSNKYQDIWSQKHILCFANLPYISTEEEVGVDVLNEDPHIALFGGGENGFECIYRFLEMAKIFSSHVKSFTVLLEFGHNQSPLFLSWCDENGYSAGLFSDQSGIERFGYCYFTPSRND